MFRSAIWRSEKNKIRAVFKLRFYATQVSQLNVDGLILSVVPGDVGKPTVRLDKAVELDGCCRWENPVFETVKFVQDPKTGKINQRVYHFVLSTTGSTKTGLVGEVSIDFADYADAIKASNVSLPLKNSNSKAVLHVSIQRQRENVDKQREVEESGDIGLKIQDHSLKSYLSNGEVDESIENDSQEVKFFPSDGPLNKATQNSELRRRASIGSDSTMSSSESISELNAPQEAGNRGNITQQYHRSFIKSLSRPSTILQPVENTFEEPQISESDWSGASEHGISTDDSTNSSQETLGKEKSQYASDVETEKLKTELVALTRQLDLSELELQSLRKQIVKETKRGQDLLRDVAGLKEERDSFKAECEKLKAFDKRINDSKIMNKLQFEGGDPWVHLEEIRQELYYEKDLNSNLRLQLQKTQESNTELILALQDLEAMLEQKNKEADDMSIKPRPCQNNEELRSSPCKSETDEDEDQKALEELVKEHKSTKEAYLLEQKITDLYNEIEIYKRDRDELEIQLEQLLLDYEILKQENHDISYKLEQSQLQEQLKMQYECSSSLVNVNELEIQVERLENELKKQSKEHSESLATINNLETQIKDLEEELEKQAQMFEADIEAVTQAKVEQEQRAIRAEEALRRTRWKNASVAEKLQEEFRRLSEQMASTFDANEKMAMKSITEANELRMQKRHLEEMLKSTSNELQTVKEEYELKLHELSELVKLKTREIEQMSKDLSAKCDQLESQKKQQDGAAENLSQEIIRLKDEIERLRMDKHFLSGQAEQAEHLRVELEEKKKSIKQAETLVERGNVEKNNLQSAVALMKKESESFMVELHEMNRIRGEKEKMVTLLQSELENVKAQCNDLKHSLVEDGMEKEKLRKQVVQLKSDLKKREDALTTAEKKLKDSNDRAAVTNGVKTGLRNNRPGPVHHGAKEVSSLKEKIKMLEGQIKLKENALGASTNAFLEKEKDLKDKIEELERILEELNQNGATLSRYQSQDGVTDNNTSGKCPNETERMSEECRNAISSTKGDNLEDLLTELASLRERNTAMESELKEMQERYSEISLKFAEVEGERQQLVMTVRNLKNSKKS